MQVKGPANISVCRGDVGRGSVDSYTYVCNRAMMSDNPVYFWLILNFLRRQDL